MIVGGSPGRQLVFSSLRLQALLQLLLLHAFTAVVTTAVAQGASKEPPPTPTRLSKRQVKQKVESLTTQLQVMTAQRNDLRDRLILVTEGSLDNRPYHRPNPFYEKLKMEHQQVMSDLQNFENENWEASQKLSELTKEKVFLCDLQSRLLMEQSQLKKKLDMLRQEKENLLEDWVLLKQHLGDLQVLSKDQEESSDLQNQQQEEQQRMEERLQSLLKQRELVTQQKHLALKLQHLLTVSQMEPRVKLGYGANWVPCTRALCPLWAFAYQQDSLLQAWVDQLRTQRIMLVPSTRTSVQQTLCLILPGSVDLCPIPPF
ncbi:disks large homolog 5-like isoform X3 [Peromyscus maniculatus bairdii]|uniref:disks large homolog 5-like isoform X3 n=1 Tax=Peromyscus maniculatus bairdii TaxID=230844 RepID=UPI003FD23692